MLLMAGRELNIDLNVKTVDLATDQHMTPEYLKMNPTHTVPTIDDDGFILWESRAIMQYLCNQYAPDSTLYPPEPKKRALVDRWLNFDMTLNQTQREALFPKMFMGVEAPEDKVNAFKNNLKLMDTQVGGDGKYLVGDSLTIADLSVLATTVFLNKLQYLKDYPNIERWFTTLSSQLPYFEEINGFDMKTDVEEYVAKIKAKRAAQHRFSGPSRAVHMTARQLNIDVNVKYMDLSEGEHMKPDFIKINPVHTVPTIVDNGFILWESRAIMQYLCNRYAPDSTLYPKEPKKMALVDRSLNYDMNLSTTLGDFTKVFVGVEPLEEKVKAFKDILKVLDETIGDNKYLTGNELTIADLSLLAGTIYIEWAEYDLKEFPNYNRWYSNLKTDKFSVPSRAVHMTARHLDIDVNFIHIDLTVKQQMEPFFIKLNPNHTIPTINDNGFVLLESRAIMQYLCNRYAPDSTLYPKEPKQRALVDRFLNFDFGFSLSQKQGSKLFKGVDASDDKVKAYENNLKIVDQLIGDNKYVTGNKLTIGDLSLLASGVFIDRMSGPSRAVLMTARHLNLDANLKHMDLSEGDQLKPEFLKINPAHTVPSIDDNGFGLWESRAIMQYLVNQYAPDSTLYPKDPKKRALVDRSLDFDQTLTNHIGEVLFSKTMTGVDPPQDKVDKLTTNLKLLDQLIGDKQYLTGEHLTIADLSLLAVTTYTEWSQFDLSDYPNYKRWYNTLKNELPYFQDINGIPKEDIEAMIENRMSGPSRAVLMTVRQLNLDVNLKRMHINTGDHLKPEYIKMNPAHKIPTINDNGFALWESRAIMQYLVNQYAPDSTLYPKDPKTRALVDRSLDFEQSLSDIFYDIFTANNVMSDEKVEKLKTKLKLLDQLIGDKRYLTGEHLTIADLSLLAATSYPDWNDFDLSDYPNYKRWYNTLKNELPYYQEINDLKEEWKTAIANYKAKATH
ncbi:unnamed protein product [Medioppia subpectinata]|uniref:Glutathione S-transferase n=1 Tax=Medioppia subpectinata TaxID=1979941 RepID=A0A7R9KL15_9ACAR|nr:unnamed protein product [Medioppia subpectinata]CAG2104324.1 unnamed protein product [Medioppia subpectinata]